MRAPLACLAASSTASPAVAVEPSTSGSGFYEKAVAAAAAAGSASKRTRLVDAPGDFISLEFDEPALPPLSHDREFADVRDAKDALRLSPWSGNRGYNRPVSDGTTLLHEEILDFAHFMAPTEAEIAARNKIVGQLVSIVKGRWPSCELQVFGSFSSGLFIPSSDIDMVLFNSGSSPVDALNELARALRRTALYRDIVVISKARIPIIKFSDASTMLMLNVAVDVRDGIASSAFVKELCVSHPCIKPLVIVLKTFLKARDLHDTYHGGVGSYLLTLMVLAAVQQCPGIEEGGRRLQEANLGALLIHFFDLWGRRFNYLKLGVRVSGQGSLYEKQAEGTLDRARPQLLSIEDPVSGSFDVGKNSYNIMMVRRAFEAAYYAITVPNQSDKRRCVQPCKLHQQQQQQQQQQHQTTPQRTGCSLTASQPAGPHHGLGPQRSTSSLPTRTIQQNSLESSHATITLCPHRPPCPSCSRCAGCSRRLPRMECQPDGRG